MAEQQAAIPEDPIEPAADPPAEEVEPSAPLPPWLARVQDQVAVYEKANAANRQLIDDYSRLFSQMLYLNNKLAQLQAQPASTESRNADSALSTVPTEEAERLKRDKDALEQQLNQQIQHNQQLQALLTHQERRSHKLANEVRTLREGVHDLRHRLTDATNQLRAKDEAIQVLQDELTTTQLELNTKDAKLEAVQKENAELIDRWLKHKAEEVQKVNDANDFVTKTMQAQAKIAAGLRTTFGSIFGGNAGAAAQTKDTPSPEEEQQFDWIPPGEVIIPTTVQRSIPAHEGDAICLATATTHNLIATGGSDKQIKIWQASNGNCLATLPAALGTILSLHFGATSGALVAGIADHSVQLYHAQSGTSAVPSRIRAIFTGHSGKVTSAVLSPREDLIVSASADRTIKVWDVAKEYCVKTMMAFSACTAVAAADYTASTVVSAHVDGKLRVWDTTSGAMAREIPQTTSGALVSVAIKDSNTVLTLGRDHALRVVDTRTEDTVHTYTSSFFKVGNTSIGVSPGGSHVAAGAADGSVFVFDLRNDEHTILTGGHAAQVNDVKWNLQSGNALYSLDRSGQLTFWGP